MQNLEELLERRQDASPGPTASGIGSSQGRADLQKNNCRRRRSTYDAKEQSLPVTITWGAADAMQ
jgi:hypothetical protein